MLIFSPKARDVIGAAVAELPEQSHRDIWNTWVQMHPSVRRFGDPADDGRGAVPRDVTAVVLAALEAMTSRMRLLRLDGALSDESIADLDNDLSLIQSIERAVYDNMKVNRVIA